MKKKKITLSPEQVYLLVPSVIPSSIYSIEPKIQSSEVKTQNKTQNSSLQKRHLAVRFI